MVRIRRAVLSTGFVGSAHRSVWKAAGAVSCAFWLQRVSLLRWFAFTMAQRTFAYAAPRCLLDGIPGSRLPGSAVYPRFRPLRTSRGSGGYAVTPAPGGRDLHPYGKLSYKVNLHLAVYPEAVASFRPTGRTSTSAVLSGWLPSTAVILLRAPKTRRRRTSTTRPCSRRLST